jgi:multidrug efflux pump subunit AcrB
VRSAADIAGTIVRHQDGHPVTIGQVADVVLGATPKRGTGAEGGKAGGRAGVQKSPGTNTLAT